MKGERGEDLEWHKGLEFLELRPNQTAQLFSKFLREVGLVSARNVEYSKSQVLNRLFPMMAILVQARGNLKKEKVCLH